MWAVELSWLACPGVALRVLALCNDVFPDEEIPARARLVLEDVFGSPD